MSDQRRLREDSAAAARTNTPPWRRREGRTGRGGGGCAVIAHERVFLCTPMSTCDVRMSERRVSCARCCRLAVVGVRRLSVYLARAAGLRCLALPRSRASVCPAPSTVWNDMHSTRTRVTVPPLAHLDPRHHTASPTSAARRTIDWTSDPKGKKATANKTDAESTHNFTPATSNEQREVSNHSNGSW